MKPTEQNDPAGYRARSDQSDPLKAGYWYAFCRLYLHPNRRARVGRESLNRPLASHQSEDT